MLLCFFFPAPDRELGPRSKELVLRVLEGSPSGEGKSSVGSCRRAWSWAWGALSSAQVLGLAPKPTARRAGRGW